MSWFVRQCSSCSHGNFVIFYDFANSVKNLSRHYTRRAHLVFSVLCLPSRGKFLSLNDAVKELRRTNRALDWTIAQIRKSRQDPKRLGLHARTRGCVLSKGGISSLRKRIISFMKDVDRIVSCRSNLVISLRLLALSFSLSSTINPHREEKRHQSRKDGAYCGPRSPLIVRKCKKEYWCFVHRHLYLVERKFRRAVISRSKFCIVDA